MKFACLSTERWERRTELRAQRDILQIESIRVGRGAARAAGAAPAAARRPSRPDRPLLALRSLVCALSVQVQVSDALNL
jgi:hypothetical protein